MAEAADVQNPFNGETTCGSLLHQLQKIWDEVGECDEEMDKMLLQLEQECLDVYKRKVDQAVKSRAHLLRALADAKLELSTLLVHPLEIKRLLESPRSHSEPSRNNSKLLHQH